MKDKEGPTPGDKSYWERRYGRPLSDDEMSEIQTNLLKLGEFLMELHSEHLGDKG